MSDAGRLEDARLANDVRTAIGILCRRIPHPAVMVAGEGPEERMPRRRRATASRPPDHLRAKLAPYHVGGPREIGDSDVRRMTPRSYPVQAVRRWGHARLQWYQ